MAKPRTSFFCQNCGAQSAKWIGRCPSCNEWNTYVEELIQSGEDKKLWAGASAPGKAAKPSLVSEISLAAGNRMAIPDRELNRVLGNGLVYGSLTLVGGEPGIGKSTLMLQLALSLKGKKVLYVSGEESGRQIRMRAERTGITNEQCYILAETSTQNIFQQAEALAPDLLIIDSIQTLYTSRIESSPGSISQVRECTAELMRYAKETAVPVFLVGHITKDGSIAGPKVLEHMVDTVLQFEGDRHHMYRILRAVKNRFGSSSEIGIYEMRESGLEEVTNPSRVLISERDELLSGVAVASTIEGARPMLIETQALVSSAVYGTPQRSATGFDLRRLNMLLAVLEKRCGFRLAAKDVFLNITGGIRVEDPAVDLAVVCAVLSSGEDVPVASRLCFSAEIGLSGEVRPVSRIEQRISEAEKLGFEKICISKFNRKSLDLKRFKIEVVFAGKIEEVVKVLF